jgi:hypothetical protein
VDFVPQRIFHLEVERQCKFALMAYEDLKYALAVYQRRPPASPGVNFADPAQVQASTVRYERRSVALEAFKQEKDAAKDRFWYAVQAFLVAAGNISKLLWPNYWKGEARLPERGPDLSASLNVDENSPLAPRTFRNHFEHFDVRLEEWAVSSNPRVLIDSNITPGDIGPGAEPGDWLRNFNSTHFTVTFRGDRYDLLPIVEAIEQLRHNVMVRLQQLTSAG